MPIRLLLQTPIDSVALMTIISYLKKKKICNDNKTFEIANKI